MLRGSPIWNKLNSITYQHGRGNNWAMSFCLQEAADRQASPGRSQPQQKQRQVVPQKPKPQFDSYNYQRFDLFAENREIVEKTKEKVRKMMERVDSCPSFFLFAGIAGGTGSGLGSRLLLELRDEVALCSLNVFTVFPLVKGETPMQHYNCGFSLQHLNEAASAVVRPVEPALHFEPVVPRPQQRAALAARSLLRLHQPVHREVPQLALLARLPRVLFR